MILNEGNPLGHYKENSRIIKYDKVGWYIPYSLVYDHTHSKHPILSEHEDIPYIDKVWERRDELKKILAEASYEISMLGFQRQTINVLIMDMERYGVDETAGLYHSGSSTIEANVKEFLKDREEFKEVIIHETAHSIWNALDRQDKIEFIKWFRENIMGPFYKEVTSRLEVDDYNDIWRIYSSKKNISPTVAIKRNIYESIKSVLENKELLYVPKVLQNQIVTSFTNAYRKNKNVLTDKTKFFDILKTIRFDKLPEKKNTDNTSTRDHPTTPEILRIFAYEKGLVPSKYAAQDPLELWAETVYYMTQNLKSLNPDLRNMIKKLIR
jgi:hypothetical protein